MSEEVFDLLQSKKAKVTTSLSIALIEKIDDYAKEKNLNRTEALERLAIIGLSCVKENNKGDN